MEKKVTNASSLKVGNYVLLDEIPCIIKSIQISKTGKHGHAKCRIEAVAMADGQKKILVMPGHDKVEIPIVVKKSAQILSITENMANVMDEETYETFDLSIPDELKDTLNEGDQVIYWELGALKILRQKK